MHDNESPNHAFTFLRTRFRTAPSTIIYDRACQLHTYCLNRDPAFFKNTTFFVDRFHWPNHKNCCQAYNINNFKKRDSLNTQVAEQRNSVLKPLQSFLCYVSEKNFHTFLRLYIWYNNNISLSQFTDHPQQYKQVFTTARRLIQQRC